MGGMPFLEWEVEWCVGKRYRLCQICVSCTKGVKIYVLCNDINYEAIE